MTNAPGQQLEHRRPHHRNRAAQPREGEIALLEGVPVDEQLVDVGGEGRAPGYQLVAAEGELGVGLLGEDASALHEAPHLAVQVGPAQLAAAAEPAFVRAASGRR